jgi:hypothetical protein
MPISRVRSAVCAKRHAAWLRDGSLRILPAADYRRLLAATPSPKAKAAPRQQEILLIDIASPEQALVKVRVRIDQIPLCRLSVVSSGQRSLAGDRQVVSY